MNETTEYVAETT